MFVNVNIFALNKLINVFIKNGKKVKSLKVFLYLLKEIKKKRQDNIPSILLINNSLNNIIPELYFNKVRRSSKVFYLPTIISEEKKIKVSLYWLKKSCNENKVILKLEDRLLNQILEAYYFQGTTIKKKESLYNLLLSNRPFLHNILYRN